MTDGPTDSEPDDGGRPEEGRILSPEELDITESEHVEQIDEDRFVVSPDATPGGGPTSGDTSGNSTSVPSQEPPDEDPPASVSSEDLADSESTPKHHPQQQELTEAAVHEWLRERFKSNPSRYGFDVTATFDGSVSQRRMASNDVVTIFESLVLWYAQQVDSNTPVEEVLGILLMEANVPIRYPTASLHSLVKSAGLEPEDSIADLLAAVDSEDGLKL